jgi:hypothetical protein|nr:MAG TPA: hypothetical protein [Caudoviricetes sp.]
MKNILLNMQLFQVFYVIRERRGDYRGVKRD